MFYFRRLPKNNKPLSQLPSSLLSAVAQHVRGSHPLKCALVWGLKQITVDWHFCSDNCKHVAASIGTDEAHGTKPIVCETVPPFFSEDLLLII